MQTAYSERSLRRPSLRPDTAVVKLQEIVYRDSKFIFYETEQNPLTKARTQSKLQFSKCARPQTGLTGLQRSKKNPVKLPKFSSGQNSCELDIIDRLKIKPATALKNYIEINKSRISQLNASKFNSETMSSATSFKNKPKVGHRRNTHNKYITDSTMIDQSKEISTIGDGQDKSAQASRIRQQQSLTCRGQANGVGADQYQKSTAMSVYPITLPVTPQQKNQNYLKSCHNQSGRARIKKVDMIRNLFGGHHLIMKPGCDYLRPQSSAMEESAKYQPEQKGL